jgi:hypothetical protein
MFVGFRTFNHESHPDSSQKSRFAIVWANDFGRCGLLHGTSLEHQIKLTNPGLLQRLCGGREAPKAAAAGDAAAYRRCPEKR